VEVAMTMMLEPTGKLDAAAKVVVNGPEDNLPDWDQVDWSRGGRTTFAAADLHGVKGRGPEEGP